MSKKELKRAPDDEKLVAWCIRPFSESLKNRFGGVAKTRGQNVPELLEEVVEGFLKGLDQ